MKILIMYEDDNGVDYDKHDIMDVPEYHFVSQGSNRSGAVYNFFSGQTTKMRRGL